MERIVLRHLSGSKANQVEEFPLNHIQELILGRDPSSTVKYDPDRDDLVGRQHARIEQDGTDPTQFTITDLNSRNGTYVNKQRIVGSTKIAPGDLIQLGPGGPEVQFDLEPRPQSAVRATRSVSDPLASTLRYDSNSSTPTTRAVNLIPPQLGSSTDAPKTVGKATVERMITENIAQTKKTEGRRYLTIGGVALAALILVFAVVASYLLYRGRASESQLGKLVAGAPMNPTAISKANTPAVVKIEVAWRLLSPAGAQVYHKYLSNVREDKKGKKPLTYVPGEVKSVACYVKLKDGTIEPYLTYDNNEYSIAISDQFSGTGFVVQSDGFILTNRHVAAAWQTAYNFKEGADTGILFTEDKDGNKIYAGQIDEEDLPRNWVPAATKQKIDIKKGDFDGRNDRLDVVFPGTDIRIAAQLVQWSDSQDVAMVKVNVPNSVPKVELYDNYDTIRSGDAAVVLGYPDSSPTRRGQAKDIPDPTVSNGNIGRLLRGREAFGNKEGIYTDIRDAYLLTVNSTDAGNSGGPVFDDHGRVIGIFYESRRTIDGSLTLALPIRYGIQLMSASSPAK